MFVVILFLTVLALPRLSVAEGEFLSPDSNIGVEVTTDKTSVPVNGKIKLNYNLYTRYDTRYEGFITSPSLRGFSINEMPMDQRILRETVEVNGKKYIKACFKEVFISPIYAGDLVINPGVVKVTIAEEPSKTKAFLGLRSNERRTVLFELKPITIHADNPTGKSQADLLAEFSNRHGKKTPPANIKADKPAVIILLDISGSMLAEDMQPQNRFFSAKAAISKFLQTNTEMMVGLKVFSRNVATVSPVTQSKSEVVKTLEGVLPELNIEDGTAIGEAVFEATKELAGVTGNKKSVILLTDGVNNSGQLDPLTAIDFASNGNITVNTIALGTKGLVPFPDPKDENKRIMAEVGTDEQTLSEMAKETGGKFGVAKNQAELEGLLNDIQKTLSESKPFKVS